MQYIRNIKLKNRLLLVFVFITLGLFSTAILGYLNINAMKKNIDSLYFGSLIPVTELNNIVHIYNNDILHTIQNIDEFELSPMQLSLQIQDSTQSIQKQWKSYQSHFKRYAERDYVQYATKEIVLLNGYLVKISQLIAQEQNLSIKIKQGIDKKVLFVNAIVKKLISYEVDMAKYNRKQFLHNYENSVTQLKIILGLIILAVLFVSRMVFKSIAYENFMLKVARKKLERANKRLENASYTDTLTTLHNRRYFNLVYEREFRRTKRLNSCITFMMLDIDYFKQYNDTYGHLEGDEALKKVANVLKETLKRPTDFVFRLGGEEFGVLLTQSDYENTQKIAQKICESVQGEQIRHKKSQVNKFLTISIGVICTTVDGIEDEDLLLSRADKMLYEAKENGRNRFVMTTKIEG